METPQVLKISILIIFSICTLGRIDAQRSNTLTIEEVTLAMRKMLHATCIQDGAPREI